jgi:hypothetical protein
VTSGQTTVRLAGLRSESLLGWLAGLGVLRALDVSQRRWRATLAWEGQPSRPSLCVQQPNLTADQIVDAVAAGLAALRPAFDFGNRQDLDYDKASFRTELLSDGESGLSATLHDFRQRLRGALASEFVTKRTDPNRVEPTGFCLMFGQGHQHFLERLSLIGSSAPDRSSIQQALFDEWEYADTSPSFRWDPLEDRRYALLAGNPSDSKNKIGTVAGANRLAVVGLASHVTLPVGRRLRVAGVATVQDGRRRSTQFVWPTPSFPVELATLERMMLGHGVSHEMRATRISNGKFMSVAQAVPVVRE